MSAAQRFEVAIPDGINHRLTITPKRITVKIMAGTDDETQGIILAFARHVATELGAVEFSWRGAVRFRTTADELFVETCLQTDRKDTKCFCQAVKDMT